MIAGCGQVGLALLRQHPKQHFTATYRPSDNEQAKRQAIAQLHATPILADLSQTKHLRKLAKLAKHWIWLAPPNPRATPDNTLKHLILYLAQRTHTQKSQKTSITYISTTGVYGPTDTQWIHEKTPINPQTHRAKRRAHAEQQLRIGLQHGLRIHILRAPGIYSDTRLPLERLRTGTPALRPEDDAYSNHIHEIDLARLAHWTHHKGKTFHLINACDQTPYLMGDYFDAVADAFKLPRPLRLSKQDIQQHVSPTQWSFMNESRRITSIEQKKIGFILQYPSVINFLKNQ